MAETPDSIFTVNSRTPKILRRKLQKAAVLWPAAEECSADDGCVGWMSAMPIGSSLRKTLWVDSRDSGLAQRERAREREEKKNPECLYEVWDNRDFKLAESGERERKISSAPPPNSAEWHRNPNPQLSGFNAFVFLP